MKQTISIIILILITSCSSFKNKRHILTYNPDLIGSSHIEKIQKYNKYDNYPVWEDRLVLNKVILIPTELKKDSLLHQTIQHINENEYIKLNKLLSNSEKSNISLNFCNGLKQLFNNNFKSALKYFQINNNPKLVLMNDILMMDCIFEINNYNNIKKEKSYYYNLYQSIIDNRDPNHEYTKIIKYRINFIK